MTESKLIDSSLWVEFLINGNYKEIIEEEEIFFLSSLSLFEIKKKLLKMNYNNEDITKSLHFIKDKSNIITPDKEICENAAEVSFNKNLSAIDSIIYITALHHNAKLITLDNDFRGLENVEVLE